MTWHKQPVPMFAIDAAHTAADLVDLPRRDGVTRDGADPGDLCVDGLAANARSCLMSGKSKPLRAEASGLDGRPHDDFADVD
jgi:hypothetical protein